MVNLGSCLHSCCGLCCVISLVQVSVSFPVLRNLGLRDIQLIAQPALIRIEITICTLRIMLRHRKPSMVDLDILYRHDQI